MIGSTNKIFIFLFCSMLSLSALAEQTMTRIKKELDAPDFTLKDMDGNVHKLSDYRGKPVIINFWATWCPPCRKEMPSMERAWQKLKDKGVALLAVDVGEDEDTIFTFFADIDANYPILLDESGEIVNQWPVKGLPTTFVLSPQGKIIYRATGGREWDDNALLEKVLSLK